MPRGISALIDIDMEGSSQLMEDNSNLSLQSEAELPKKKGAKKTANATSKPKAAPRKPKAGKEDGATKPAAKTGTKRKAAQDQVDLDISQPTKKRAGNSRAQSDDELEGSAEVKPAEKPKARKKTTKKAEAAALKLVEEPQPEAQFIEAPTSQTEVAGEQSSPVRPARQTDAEPITNQAHAKKAARDPARLPLAGVRRRAGSASDTERGDPNLRRKLGDVTRKFENIDLKYRSLRDVGIVEANANMDKLRRQCESTTAASNDLIGSLKKELSIQTPLANEARQLQADLKESKKRESKIDTRLAELESSLATAQNEVKALQAKLAAARSSATSGTPKKGGLNKSVMAGNAEVAQTAQLKEALYSDLTGLIIRGVKRTEEDDSYDCIQTGRNGTLHFKLFVEAESHDRTTNFEEAEFQYKPLLDQARDRELLELLPHYLKDDITFSRFHAAKFYSRVADALTKNTRVD